mgnify:CR=1 FL=1
MSNNSKNRAMKTMYREPLTAEEINLHKNNYENETPAVYIGTYGKYNEGSLFGYQKQNIIRSGNETTLVNL